MRDEVEQLRARLEKTERERDIGLLREAALARIAQRINEHPLDIDGTLIAIAEAARELTDGDNARVWFLDGDQLIPGPGAIGRGPQHYASSPGAIRLASTHPYARAVRERIGCAIDDILEFVREIIQRGEQTTVSTSSEVDTIEHAEQMVKAFGTRAAMAAPLGRLNPLGSISVTRMDVRPFSTAEMVTLEAFAAQAAVAIETARSQQLLAERNREIAAALDRQNALAGVLNVIASSATDAGPVLEAILETGSRLCAADSANAVLVDADQTHFQLVAAHGLLASRFEELRGVPRPIESATPLTRRALVEGRAFCGDPGDPSLQTEDYNEFIDAADRFDIVSSMLVPMLRNQTVLGALFFHRTSGDGFNSQQVALIESFAAQAVIAIENARVFNELQQRNAEITEALAREEANSDILRLISNAPEELAKTLQAIPEAAHRLTGMLTGLLLIEEGQAVVRGYSSGEEFGSHRETMRNLIGQSSLFNSHPAFAQMLRDKTPIVRNWSDRQDTPSEQPLFGVGSWALVPIRQGDSVVGVINMANATGESIRPAMISMVQSFADQAAIAIENARLIRELRESDARTREALDVQRVMARVLGIVAGAPSNLESSLPEIAGAAKQLTGADVGVVLVPEGNRINLFSTARGASVDADGMARWSTPEGRSVSSVAIFENRIVEVAGPIDTWAAEYPRNAKMMIAGGASEAALLAVPLPALAGSDGAVGSILVTRGHAIPFSEAQRAILFALGNQAVIAIQNARLFGELQARNAEITEALKREKAGSAILRQISESPEKLEETLQAIADASLALTGCTTAVWKREGQESVLIGAAFAAHEMPGIPIGLRQRTTKEMEIAIQSRSPALYRIDNRLSEQLRSNLTAAGETTVRNLAYVPVVSAGEVTAVLVLANCEESAVPLIQSFADQAAIAIENARLIQELRESNQTISENLDRQTVMGRVMAIVASAPSDLDATLPPIAAAAKHLCNADLASVAYLDDGVSHVWDDIRGHFDADAVRLKGVGAGASFPGAAMLENRAIEVVGPIEEWAAQYPRAAEITRANGRTALAALAVPMPGPDGPIGAILVIRNEARPFTARHRLALEALANQAVIAVENARLFKQLQTKSEELEIASRHKSEFLANMSHELRTPLNAIIGYAELLQEECEDLGQQEFMPDLGKIHSAGNHLLTLISGILDLSKVEAGRMTMFLEDFDIATLIRDADAIVRPLVEKNSNTFIIDCPDDIGVMHADLVKVRQVLFNLLSNAAKFTENGTITLSVGSHTEDNTIHMAIRDTGIGMTEAQLGRLFEAFSQASAETSRKYGGTGLGLALSREFCRMMGGDIAVTSQHGLGSAFTILLPRRCVPMEDAS